VNLALPSAWRRRTSPLAASAVVALGPVVSRLAEHLLRRPGDALARLHGVAAPDLLVLLGDLPDLPWVDGVVYLGRDPHAPALLLPTTLEPRIHPALLERTLQRSLASQTVAPPLAVLLGPPRLISLADARPVTPARLRGHCSAPAAPLEVP